MSTLKKMMRRTAGLFVEFEEEDQSTMTPMARPEPLATPVAEPKAPAAPTAKTVEQIVRETEGPNLDEVNAVPVENKPIFRADGGIDFEGIYHLAGLKPVADDKFSRFGGNIQKARPTGS